MPDAVVNIFICCYLVFVVLYDTRPTFPPRKWLARPLDLLGSLGFGHTWAMYAPDPPKASIYLEVQARLADGSAVQIELDCIPGVTDGRRGSRLRNITFMRSLITGSDEGLRRQFCTYAAEHLGDAAHGHTVRSIELIKVLIPTPSFEALTGDRVIQESVERTLLFEYELTDEGGR